MKTLTLVVLISTLAPQTGASAANLVIPSPAAAAYPGQITGWGFAIGNTDGFLVVESSDFCVGAYATPCANSLGVYTDFIGPSFIVVGPAPESPLVSQPFDLLAMTGLGSFEIDPGAAVGEGLSGDLYLVYSLYSRSPNDPAFSPDDFISGGNLISAPVQVRVGEIPEPGTLIPVVLGLAACVASRVRRPGRGSRRPTGKP